MSDDDLADLTITIDTPLGPTKVTDSNNLPAGRALYSRKMKLWQEVDSLHQEEEFMAGSALPIAERQ